MIILFLNQLLEDYREANEIDKQEILNSFLQTLWNSKFKFSKYKKYITYKINGSALDNNQDLISLFDKYNNIEYWVCRSFYKQRLDFIDYIRVHINNMYGYLFNKEVYYKSEYYKLLQTPKNEYYRVVKVLKGNGNIDFKEIKDNIEEALQKAEEVKINSINKKSKMKFNEYQKLINTYIKRIFNNYIPVHEYEEKHGWDMKVNVDGWCEDNYVIKYFCKSLTGYMRNYIKELNKPKEKYCCVCNIDIPNGTKRKYCDDCAKMINIKKTITNRRNKNV